ncbi:MAG: hypothetical protein NC093_07370 [Alistipes sp.]|nr:hypothetical protein [Alistipes sp.]
MKKVLSILSALALLTTFSCSQKPAESDQQKQTSYTAEKLSDVVSYKKNNLPVPESCSQIWTFMPYNSGEDYLLLGSGTKSPEFWHTKDFKSYETVDFPDFEIGANYTVTCANDGTVVTFLSMPDQEMNDDWTYPEGTQFKFMINTYKDGALASSVDVEDFGVEAQQNSSISEIYTDGETVIVGVSGSLEMFKITGEYVGELTSEKYDIDAVGNDKSGRLICTAASTENDSDVIKLCYVNADGTLTDCNSIAYDFSETPQGIQIGSGDYDLFIWSRTTVFGIKSDGEIEPLFNINAAGLTSDMINGMIITENGNIAVINNDYSTWSVFFREFIPRTAEEMEGIPVLTLGAVNGGDYMLREYVTAWNDEGHDFILEYKDYQSEWDIETGVSNISGLQEDMLTGNLPDIMIGEDSDFNELARNGALCDLYEFIDNDDTLSRDSFFPNVLNCFENDGKLYSLSDRFYLDAGRVAKTKFVGDGSDWNLDKTVDVLTEYSDNIEIEYDSKQQRLSYIISYPEWIDRENATCHYTDESFIKYLEWCNIPDNIESEYPDWEERTDEEEQADYIRQQRRYIDDKAIFADMSWMNYMSYVQDTRGMFNGEEITYLEAPTINMSDCFSICSTSEYKELAWEFIKSKLTDEAYTTGKNEWKGPFPVTKSGVEIYLQNDIDHYTDFTQYEEITDPEWLNYRGVTYQLGFQIYGDDVMQLGEITDEDVKFVNDMIERAEPGDSTYLSLGNDYYEIMDDELNRFFNGETTAQQCAEFIQDRVSIYLSEKFG